VRRIVVVVGTVVICMFSSLSVLQAADGEGIRTEGYVISPYAELQSIYDSNVETQPNNTKSDVSFTLKAGADFRNTAEKIKLKGDIWGLTEKYIDLKAEDHSDFGESLDVKWLDLGSFTMGVNESYQDIQSLDYSVGRIEARKLLKAGIGAGNKITDKLDVNLDYLFSDTAYESPRMYSWNEQTVTFVGANNLTDKSAGTLTVAAGNQTSDGNQANGKLLTALVGVKSRQTDKVVGNAGIGVIRYSGEADASRFAFVAGVNWTATPKVNVFVDARNGFEPGTIDANNVNFVSHATLGADWAFVDSLALKGFVMYSRNDYIKDVVSNEVLSKKKDDTMTEALRLTYTAPAKFLQIFLEGKYEDKTSTISANEYSQTMVTLGAKYIY